MKIIHIIRSLHTGGAEKFCVDMCNELSKDCNNEVTLCALEKLDDNQSIMYNKLNSNVKFISLGKEGKSFYVIFKILRMIFSLKPDVTHTHARAQIYSALGILLYNKPNIHTVHTIAHKEVGKILLKIHKFLYNNFNFTPVSISKLVLKSVINIYGKKYNAWVDNGTQKLIKSEKFYETKKFIDSLKKNENTKIFISIGRLYDIKNQKLLIKAFEAFLDEGHNACLLIVGSQNIMPEYANTCKNLITKHNNIKLLGEKSNISDYLLLSDALCFSSIYEGLPMAIIEAMSIGIPTISTPVGGIPDVVIDGETGYLSKDMSVNSYKEVLKRFIIENSIDKKLLIEHYNKYYTIEKCTEQYMNLYKEKVEQREIS